MVNGVSEYGRIISCTLLTLRAGRQGDFAEPGWGYQRGCCFHGSLSFRSYVDLGKEIWKTSVLEEPGFPKEPCLTLKGGVDTTQLRDANWRSCASWDEDGN